MANPFAAAARMRDRERELKDRLREAEMKKAEAEARLAEAELEKRLQELRREDGHDEDAKRGRKVKASASKGGLALRNEDRNESIVEAVIHLHDSRPHLSWTEVGKRVGKEHDISGRRVRGIAKKAGVEPWRSPG